MSADWEQRRRAIEETDRSFVVEASAGTGKTTVLIRRILHCVLEAGPGGKPLPLARICAITFTEKAAGEMKIRLRQEFEKQAAANDETGARARQALQDLESAAISTIHAFAVSLLKERPIEAGLDPHFTPLDTIQSDLLFQEVWEAWLHAAIEERLPALEQALRADVSLDVLRAAARTLRLHAHDVRRLKLPAPLSEAEVRTQFDLRLEEGRRLLAHAGNPDDKLVPCLEAAMEWLLNPDGDAKPSKPGGKGAAGNWLGGKTTVEEARNFVRDIVEARAGYQLFPVQRALDAALRLLIGSFLPEWENRKRARGFLDFDDLLWCARDLLKSSRAARAEFHQRFAALLVDEFQDTDPVQWELIQLLAADPDPAGAETGVVTPGRLFIVGDPKQSIYRFRGADIETYGKIIVREAMNPSHLERLELTTNFRSVPSILAFVDAAFRDVMKNAEDRPYQPDYLAFGGQGSRAAASDASGVRILADRKDGGSLAGSGRDFFALECRRIAALILSMQQDEGWEVQHGTTWHRPRLRDIAILLPVLTRSGELEDALREFAIPYVLEGGKFYYNRSEVNSAVTVLRAVANPNDGVALYGALRSIFFGVSDEDLLRVRAAGLPLDYRAEVPETSDLHRPFQVLRELHAHRHARPASETLERLFQQTGAREVLAARGIQSLANLHKLVRTLRSLQQDTTFSGVIDLVSGMDEEEIAESESRIMEEQSDAVRVLSIHRAKGLDFPIVIAAGLGLKRTNRQADFLMDPHGQKIFGMKVGSKESGLRTPGWESLAEADKEREDAELTRLLYVALTRARDHLVLCAHTRGKGDPTEGPMEPQLKDTRLNSIAGFLDGLGGAEFPAAGIIDPTRLPDPPPKTAGSEEPQDQRWTTDLAARYQELDLLIAQTPAARGLHTATEGPDHKAEADFARAPALERAIRLGIAFHEAMDLVDLADPGDVASLARETGARHGLEASSVALLARMLADTLASPLIERARRAQAAGRRVCRELPYVRPLGPDPAGGIEEGKIDLLFEEDGSWVLVDYKTDRLPKEAHDPAACFAAKYGAQIRSYVAALKLINVQVKDAYLLLANCQGQAVAVQG
jgi:ATP-dependent helicase/nuclease subunit A